MNNITGVALGDFISKGHSMGSFFITYEITYMGLCVIENYIVEYLYLYITRNIRFQYSSLFQVFDAIKIKVVILLYFLREYCRN